MRPLLLLALLLPITLRAQATKPKPQTDTLTRLEREALREANDKARQQAQRNLAGDSTTRRRRADSAAVTAFADPGAREILARARVARLAQDSALTAYRATTTQRISVGMGVRRVGLEKLLWRGDNVAQVNWKRGIGVRVTPIGSRMTVPMASDVSADVVEAVSIPYYPGKETLWFPGEAFSRAKAEINERELIHPLARGSETYYRYATGDSAEIRLPDGSRIRLQELRITPRKPQWRTLVGSFWFDRDRGQLVRAAYRLAIDIDIWSIVSEEAVAEALENRETARLRDSVARAQLPRELYVKDSSARAERERQRSPRSKARNTDDDDVPAWVKGTFRPAKAKLDAITVEYGLYLGRFWLPRANSATASAQMGFIRVPLNFDEKFSYDQVNGDFSMKPLPPPVPTAIERVAGTLADSADVAEASGSVTVSLGGRTPDSLSTTERTKRDSIALSRLGSRARAQCRTDSTWTRVRSHREDSLQIAYDMPCQMSKLTTSPALPPATASDEELFDVKSRDELMAALDMGLQPGWSPMPIRFHVGADLLRYNRVEGLSVGAAATEELGAGYTLSALGRIGHADLHANGELSLARSAGQRTVTGTIYHRLAAANPEWGGALTLGPSLPAVLYARDEGFYYRTLGAELRDSREFRGGSMEYGLFLERQWTAGDSDVVNTFSLGRLLDNRRFGANLTAEKVSVTGVSGSFLRAFGDNPNGLRLVTATRAEAGTGTFEYGRLSFEGTLTRTLGRFALGLTGSAGSSTGRLPTQRRWYLGGVHTVRGQVAGTQSGDAYWLGRAEIGTAARWARPVLFYDMGWAGSRKSFSATAPQRGMGIGFGLLDGLLRIDFARGLWPSRKWRTDLYLGATL